MERIHQPVTRPIILKKAVQSATILLGIVGLAVLALVASGRAYTDLDVRITGWVQGLDAPGLHAVSVLVNFLTDGPMAIVLWLVAMTVFVLKGRPIEAIAIFLISGVWVANEFVSTVVDRPSPMLGVGGAVEFSRTDSGSFPSGHVTGAVVFYGLLAFLALSNVKRGHLRVSVPVAALAVIGITSLSRVYVGAHWSTDVLGSYLMGCMGVAGIAWLYTNVKYDTLHIPLPRRKKQLEPVIDGVTTARSIASKVYLDWQAGTATKEYHPPLPVRALYWMAFQAPFPYQVRRDALEAAAAIRKIAGLLTRHRYGYDMVAQVYGIENSGGSYRFVTELVPGAEPESNSEVADLLSEMYTYFQEVGLPTWQIAPGNPHAYSNFIRKPDGEMKLIDLESALVSTSYPWKELRAALRDGNFPVFDDVDFVQLREYMQSRTPELKDSLGHEGFEELERAVERAEVSSRQWKDSEPRVWGRLTRRVYRLLDISRFINPIRRRMVNAEGPAKAFAKAGIERWERSGQIDAERAASLEAVLSTSEAETLLKHMGAHMVLSVAIAIPIPGLRSAARFIWTLTFRLKAVYALARGRMKREEYRKARSVHSVPVMLIALLPAFGAIAYVASGTMTRKGLGRLLVDQAAYKMPFGLYHRLGVGRITAPQPSEPHPTGQMLAPVRVRNDE